MASNLQKLAKLNMLLVDMEQEMAIDDLSTFEKQVLLATVDCVSDKGETTLRNIEAHPLTEKMSRPSFFRALKHLEQNGKIKKVSKKRGYYTLAGEYSG